MSRSCPGQQPRAINQDLGDDLAQSGRGQSLHQVQGVEGAFGCCGMEWFAIANGREQEGLEEMGTPCL
jgi:hypothetical protein